MNEWLNQKEIERENILWNQLVSKKCEMVNEQQKKEGDNGDNKSSYVSS